MTAPKIDEPLNVRFDYAVKQILAGESAQEMLETMIAVDEFPQVASMCDGRDEEAACLHMREVLYEWGY